jgi:hypothetical protein
MIFPDGGTIRTVKKMIRGLVHHHYGLVVAADRIEARKLEYHLPTEFEQDEGWTVVEPKVSRYWHETANYDDCHSAWLLDFHRHVRFIGWVKRPGLSPGPAT